MTRVWLEGEVITSDEFVELLKEEQNKKAGKGKEAATTGRSQMRSRSTGLDAMALVANGVTISVLDTRESHRKKSLFL